MIVGIYDAQTVALSYPHGLVGRFEDGIDEIIVYDGWMGFVIDQIGWLTQRFDDDAIVVVGNPDFSIASLDNIRDTCGQVSRWDVVESRNFLVEERFASLAVVQGYAVWIQSQPEMVVSMEYT